MVKKKLLLLAIACIAMYAGSAVAEDYSVKVIRFAHVVSENTPKHQGRSNSKNTLNRRREERSRSRSIRTRRSMVIRMRWKI